jgi:adenylate cyclase
MDFTVIGDTVNLASRLESITRQLPASVIIDSTTAELIKGTSGILIASLGRQPIKGLDDREIFAINPGRPVLAGCGK